MKNKKRNDYSLLFNSEEVIDKGQMNSLKGGVFERSCSDVYVGTWTVYTGTICTTVHVGFDYPDAQ